MQPDTHNTTIALLREAEVRRRTGLSRTTRWRLARRGLFPRPRQISPNAIAWVSTEIDRWIESRRVTSAMAVITNDVDAPTDVDKPGDSVITGDAAERG